MLAHHDSFVLGHLSSSNSKSNGKRSEYSDRNSTSQEYKDVVQIIEGFGKLTGPIFV